MILERNQHFALLLIDPGMPKFAWNNRVRGAADEIASAVKGSFGYFGTYANNREIVTLKLEGCTYPDWTGATLELSIGPLSVVA